MEACSYFSLKPVYSFFYHRRYIRFFILCRITSWFAFRTSSTYFYSYFCKLEIRFETISSLLIIKDKSPKEALSYYFQLKAGSDFNDLFLKIEIRGLLLWIPDVLGISFVELLRLGVDNRKDLLSSGSLLGNMLNIFIISFERLVSSRLQSTLSSINTPPFL